MANAPCASMAH